VTHYRIRHETVYFYAEPVVTSHNELHLAPRRLPNQTLRDFSVSIDPSPETLRTRRDYFGNEATYLELREPHARLAITATSRVARLPVAVPDVAGSPPWEDVAARVRGELRSPWLEALEFALPSALAPAAPELAAYAQPSFAPGRPFAAAVLDLCARIHREFVYDPAATTLSTPVVEVLHARRGVCQDFAHLAIGCLRALGLPARYVSGYLRTRQPGDPVDRELVGADASHAWLSAFCPHNGWIDVDPTNDAVPSDCHVTLAWGRDYDDVSPVKGVTVGGGAQTMQVAVELVPEE
jgi:transglutaminase-like putative cysteine protease